MDIMKRSVTTILGALFILLGLVFLIIPGPSIVFILPGLVLLSLHYPAAKPWLKKCMKLMRVAAVWIDKQLLDKKYR
jgi:hypothetical protein